MAFIDYEKKQIQLKVVYYGPAGSGKTSCLHYIYARTRRPDAPPRFVGGGSSSEGHYEYLPLSFGALRGFQIEMGLLAVPSGAHYQQARREGLRSTDGIIFVADSRHEHAAANLASLQELRLNLQAHGFLLEKLPFVLQLNHSDAPAAVSPAAMATPLIRWHPDPAAIPVQSSCALSGTGIFEALKAISRQCLMELKRGQGSG